MKSEWKDSFHNFFWVFRSLFEL